VELNALIELAAASHATGRLRSRLGEVAAEVAVASLGVDCI
jgi:hypothetical protein